MTDQPVTPATVSQIAAARVTANILGLYFHLQDPTTPDPTGAGPAAGHGAWRPAALLYEPGTGGPLDELLDAVQARLGGCERRVAASLFYQGYAARLLSPQLGCLATGGFLPTLGWQTPAADQLSWREPATEMIQLGLPPGPGWQGPAEPLLSQLLVQSFTAHLQPLATAIQTRVHLAADVLQDNAASALVSGLRLLDHRLADGWRPLATRALADPRLPGSGTLTATEPGFIRRSCCLYYRTQSGGLCGDCPLNHPGRRTVGRPAG